MTCSWNEPRQETKRSCTHGDGRCSGTTPNRGRESGYTAQMQAASPKSSPSEKQQGANALSCLPRKSVRSSKSRDGRRFVVIGGVRFRLGIANAVVP